MSLALITGPAGSGKTGEMLERFAASLEREPVLVVPTLADVERFEDEVLVRRPVALGGRIATFEGLFTLVAGATGAAPAPLLSPAQRRAIVAASVRGAKLEALAAPARRPGFARALDGFFREAAAALVGPTELARGLDGAPAQPVPERRQLRELVGLYSAYLRRRDELARSDALSLARATLASLRARPQAWGGRPVLVHGFDDLTPAQLSLVEELASCAEVVVSVVHEPGRACLAARGRLVDRLERLSGREESHGAAPLLQLRLDHDAGAGRETGGDTGRIELPPRAATGLLAHLERAFLTDAPGRATPGDELRLLEAAGIRNEIELVASEIARLLRAGVAPDEIAVIARSTEDCAALVEDVFSRFDIQAAVEADRPLAATPTGRGLIALVRAALLTRTAGDLVVYLRSPGRAPVKQVDLLERAVRTEAIDSADEAIGRWRALGGRRLWELEALRELEPAPPPALLEQLAAVAREMAERPRLRQAPVVTEAAAGDLAAAESIAGSLREIAELAAVDPGLAPDARELVTMLEALGVPRASGGVRGRVEVMSPYRARARQFPHVFVISLQEGDFPRRRREDPFLTEDQRREAGLPSPADQRDEERYLFYVCLTRATRTLHLSFRSADDEGRAATRSFFVDEVLDLLVPGAEAELTRSRGLSATVFEASEAPTRGELARALAERRLVEPPAELGASVALVAELSPQLLRARERAARLPGRLRVPFVVEQFAAKRQIGASSLERQAECSFRYFVDHELQPDELAPGPEPLTRGAIAHRVLERVYADYRGRRVTAETADAAIERARAILAEEAAGTSLDPRSPATRAAYRRMEADIVRFLRDDAEHGGGVLFEVEASFGEGKEDDRPALGLEGFELHGKIDRIDLIAPGRALIRDYKTGSNVATRKQIAEQKKLQLPLYMLAVRELWGLEPVGAVYHPLGKQHGGEARGLLRGPRDNAGLRERFVSKDYTSDDEEFERALADARREAEALAARIHSGHLARDPLGGSCPDHCDFHPICRRERGEKNPELENGEREANGDE